MTRLKTMCPNILVETALELSLLEDRENSVLKHLEPTTLPKLVHPEFKNV